MNSAYTRLVGRQPEQLLNRSIRESLPELAGQGFLELLDQVYSSGTPYVGIGLKAILNRDEHRTAEAAYFDFVYHPMRSVAGEVESIMVFAIDVTQRAMEKAELEASVQERTGPFKVTFPA